MNWHRPAALAVILGAALGATRASARSGIAELRLAQEHLSAVRVVQRWVAIAYNVHPDAANGCTPSFGDFTFNDDGSFSQQSVGQDCSTSDLLGQLDGSFKVTTHYPDGLSEQVTAVAGNFLIPDPPLLPQQFEFTDQLSTGDRAHYIVKFDLEDNGTGNLFIVNTTTDGTLTTASGQTFQIHFVQPRPTDATTFTDTLDVTLPGHERLHLQIPSQEAFNQLGNPVETIDFTRPVAGSYTAGTNTIRFQVEGDGNRFTRWSLGDGGKLAGIFALNQDFSGSGRALKGRQLQFVGKWDQKARGTILLSDGQAAVAGPSRGASDFGNLKFRAFGLANAPSPGF